MRIFFAIVLAACSSAPPAAPHWPKSAARPSDGGESLAPRAAARAIAVVAEDDKPADRAVAADKPSAAPATDAAPVSGPADKPPATTSAPAASEEPITTEGIVIEIED